MNRSLLFGVGDVVGHRGFGRGLVESDGEIFAENTVSSCLKAYSSGARWVEIDLRFGVGEIFLHHGRKLANGGRVSKLNSVHAPSNGVESLRFFFSQVPKDLGVVLEIKGVVNESKSRLLENLVVREIHSSGRNLVIYGFGRGRSEFVKSIWDRSGRVFRFGIIKPPLYPIERALRDVVNHEAEFLALHSSSLIGMGGRVKSGVKGFCDHARDLSVDLMSWCPRVEYKDCLLSLGVGGVCVDDVLGWG